MIDAGMLPADKDPDDQETKPPPDDGTQKPPPTIPVSSAQPPADGSDMPPPTTSVSSVLPPYDGSDKPSSTSPVSSPQPPADGTEKPPPTTPVSSTQIPTTVATAQPPGPVLSYNNKIVADAQVMYCNFQKALAASKHEDAEKTAMLLGFAAVPSELSESLPQLFTRFSPPDEAPGHDDEDSSTLSIRMGFVEFTSDK